MNRIIGKITLFSLALLAASLPLFGQALVFHDDFSTSEANGNPSREIWGSWGLRQFGTAEDPFQTMKVTNENSASYFGEENNGYLHIKYESGTTAAMFLEAQNTFTPSTVLTVAFDFYMPSTTTWGVANTNTSPRFMLGVYDDASSQGPFASGVNRIHQELQFQGGSNGISGTAGVFQKDTTHSIAFVYNNSLAEVDYANGNGGSLSSGSYDVWIDGVRVVENRLGAPTPAGFTRLEAGDALSSIGFGSFGVETEFFIDNLSVYSGAVIPEPSTYAIGAGLLALLVAAVSRRLRRSSTV